MHTIKRAVLLLILTAISVQISAARVLTGIETLRNGGFKELQGKRVGLVTNPTGVDGSLVSTIDILHAAQGVTLAALFAPEHGVRGNVTAGVSVANATDPATGVKVFSLYGASRKPTPEALKGIDAVVFDIQDIGSRSYTYISTMGLVMEAAAENNIEVVILDRPNPLGGVRIEGAGVEDGFRSFVSQYPIPYIHGMSVGELATMLNETGMLKNGAKCTLTVIPMQGWRRDMNWDDTQLPWVPTSPHIPTCESAVYYPITGMVGELGTLNIGVGYTLPFQTLAAEWIADADALARRLNARALRGVTFRPIHYKPYYGGGVGKEHHGVQIYVDGTAADGVSVCSLTLLPFYVIEELHAMYPGHKPIEESANLGMFDKVMGSNSIRNAFVRGGYKVSAIEALWTPPASFRDARQKYLLY